MSEQWKPIPGHEGLYEASDLGRIRSVRTNRVRRTARGNNGYLRIGIPNRDGRLRHLVVHSLVASLFIGPRPTGLQVNHKDGDKANNAAANLEYVTPLENVRHAMAMGLRRTASPNSRRRRRAS